MPEFRDTNKAGAPATRRTCPQCGRLGHLARTCSGTPRSHDKIGIEIEGWWRDLNAAKAVAREHDASGTSDGSLASHDEMAAWEFRTRPGSLGEAVNQLVALYPDATHSSAGMHVHVSFQDPCDLSVLASGRFLSYHRARWESWGTRMGVHRDSNFWERLNGDNTDYCALNREDVLHRNPFGGSRYVQLNFSSFTRHRTLENRMLPLFRDMRLGIAAVEELVSIYEDFLRDADALALHDLRRSHDITVDLPSAPGVPVATVRQLHQDVPVVLAAQRTAVAETRTTEVSAPTMVEPQPVTPGHVRLFGRVAATNYVRRQLAGMGG